jgi:hypothetical protein
MKPRLAVLALIGSLLPAAIVHAHSVWIEETRGGLVVRFGEFADQEWETSPGHLDELSLPDAWVAATNNAVKLLTVKKKSDRFLLTGANATKPAFAETIFEVLASTNHAARKPIFYARWHPTNAGAGKPTLTFDLVPTGTPGEMRLYFHGKPLGGATVTLTDPDKREVEQVTDSEGLVRFAGRKPGLYFATSIRQRDLIAGFYRGNPYDMVSHNCSLVWRQP